MARNRKSDRYISLTPIELCLYSEPNCELGLSAKEDASNPSGADTRINFDFMNEPMLGIGQPVALCQGVHP